MKVLVFENAAQIGEAAAAMIAAQLLRKPDSVLGLATGSSPILTYQGLIALYQRGALDFSKAVSYNLDEYLGIPQDHLCSYHRFMDDNLFNHVNMRREAIHVPDGNDLDPEGYDRAIDAAGGIDLQLLGVGRNGHIGFNEPGDSFIPGCHIVNLTRSTIEANTRFFDSEADVPKQAVTLGIGQIMKARQVLLIATGKDKAQAIHDSVKGLVTPAVQASILQFHPDCTFLVDQAAASLL